MKIHSISLATALLGAAACGPRFEPPVAPAPIAAPASAGAPGWVTSYTWVDPIGGGVPIPEEDVYVDSAGVAYDRRTGHELRYLEHQRRALEHELVKEQRKAAEAEQAREIEREQEKLDKAKGRAAEPRHEDERSHLE